MFAAAVSPKNQAETVQTGDAEIHEEISRNEVTTAAVTTAISSQISESLTTSCTDNTEPDSTDTTSDDDNETKTTCTDEATDITENDESSEQNEPAETPEETEPPAPVKIYQDGTFTASAYGYDGNIIVHVSIQDDRITDITAETEELDDTYFADAKALVIPAIISSQSTEVDACSGATFSSNGIMEAVRAALESAKL